MATPTITMVAAMLTVTATTARSQPCAGELRPRLRGRAPLNAGFVVGEAVYGLLGHSLALLADAGHNLGDVLGPAGGVVAASRVKAKPRRRYTYGLLPHPCWRPCSTPWCCSSSPAAVAAEAVRRILNPRGAGVTVMIVARRRHRRERDHGADVRLPAARATSTSAAPSSTWLADAWSRRGVVVAGGVILLTGLGSLDSRRQPWRRRHHRPVGTWGLLEGRQYGLQAAPPGRRPDPARRFPRAREQRVEGDRRPHIWPMTTTETALTAHLLVPTGHPGDDRSLTSAWA